MYAVGYVFLIDGRHLFVGLLLHFFRVCCDDHISLSLVTAWLRKRCNLRVATDAPQVKNDELALSFEMLHLLS